MPRNIVTSYMGTLAYSPTLTLWFNRKILWSLVHKKLTGGMVTSCCIQCLAHHCEISNPLLVSIEAALFNFKATAKECQDLQPKASQLQVEFFQQKLLSPGLSVLSAGSRMFNQCVVCLKKRFPDSMTLSFSHLSRRLSNTSVMLYWPSSSSSLPTPHS